MCPNLAVGTIGKWAHFFKFRFQAFIPFQLQTPHDGLSLPEKPSGSSTDDKEVDDFDVLVLGPEVADSLDIKLM